MVVLPACAPPARTGSRRANSLKKPRDSLGSAIAPRKKVVSGSRSGEPVGVLDNVGGALVVGVDGVEVDVIVALMGVRSMCAGTPLRVVQ